MPQRAVLASHQARLVRRIRLAASNAWTRVAADPVAPRRVAALRFWDGDWAL
jgi:hypothetical protein